MYQHKIKQADIWNELNNLRIELNKSTKHSIWKEFIFTAKWLAKWDETSNNTPKYVSSWENLILLQAKNKGVDQPAHRHSLVSAFAIRFLGSLIAILTTCDISML